MKLSHSYFLLPRDKFLVWSDLRSISSATPVFALHLWVVCRHDDLRLCVLGCIRVARLYTSLLSVFRLAGRPALTWACGTRFLRKSCMDEKVKCTSLFALKAAGCPIFRPSSPHTLQCYFVPTSAKNVNRIETEKYTTSHFPILYELNKLFKLVTERLIKIFQYI